MFHDDAKEKIVTNKIHTVKAIGNEPLEEKQGTLIVKIYSKHKILKVTH